MIPDPSLGIKAGFDRTMFESAVRFAMQMGTPQDPDKRPVFIFSSTGVSYWKDGVELPTPPHVDSDGVPLDPTIEVRKADEGRVSIDCAIEAGGGGGLGEIPVGRFPVVRLTVTVLDADYHLVQGCAAIEYNGDRYTYDHEPENVGLFDSGIHTMIFVSEDET